jgi:cytoplasmic iron level regulating protein YaaA (DUF328/UPF0246 family)
MLIIAPSSEGKRVPEKGVPLDLGALGYAELTPVREQLLDALIAVSRRRDAAAQLGLPDSLADALARNRELRSAATLPAIELYRGIVHTALDAASLPPTARKRMERQLVIASALFGLLRPGDRIPPYRLPIDARLDGVGRVAAAYRSLLPDLLTALANETAVILDLRAGSYRAAGLPVRRERDTVVLRLADGVPGGNVALKQLRGTVARELLLTAATPADPDELARIVAASRPARLITPRRKGAPRELHCGRG